MSLAIAKPLSSVWAARTHRALGTTTDKAIRLALALGAVKSIIRVVDRSVPLMQVDWAAVDDSPAGSKSYTDFQRGQIKLNPLPILDTAIGHGQALDICVGLGLHEASHSQESRDRYKYLVRREPIEPVDEGYPPRTSERLRETLKGSVREVPAFAPMRIAAYLWNLVEDVRIEKATSRNWPGFAPYFEAVLDWMWTQMRSHHELPTEYKPDLTSRMRTVFLACRYPARFSPEDGPGAAMLISEVEWWQAWQHDYLTDAVDTPTTIQRGLDHLAEDEETAKEIEDHKAAEKAEREAGEKVRAQIERLIREGVGGYSVCAMDEGEVIPLDDETAEAVRQLVREGLVEHKTIVTGSGVSLAPVTIRRPEETGASRRAYVGRPAAQTEAMRAALVFRDESPAHDIKLLKAGQMDDAELYRWAMDDTRVFSERIVEAKPEAFLGLLVDISGSMAGRKLQIAQRLAQTFVWATHDAEGVETAVWAHTADLDRDPSAEVYRIWAKGDPLSRLGLLGSLDNANNRDGQAIEVVAAAMAEVPQPEKVLVVLSDGIPSGDGYGRQPAMAHVRSVVRWAASRGVRVIQVAIDPHDIRPDEQAQMYSEWVPFRDYASLPRQLTQILGRFV